MLENKETEKNILVNPNQKKNQTYKNIVELYQH